MRALGALTILWVIAGCNEYNLQGDASIYAEPNPPDLALDPVEDRIVQVTVPSVDVLWVIDNSCSMGEEQAALATNFPKFVNYFLDSGLDYHIGVVSTGWDEPLERGKLREAAGVRYIDDTTASPVDVFRQMAEMGVSGPDQEKGRAQVWGALNLLKDGFNEGFMREDANLAIVVISDENDYSGNTPVSLSEFIPWLQFMKPQEDMVSFSSIVGPRPSGCATAEAGTQYLNVTDAVGGIEWSICNDAWDQVLEELGMQAAGLKREFFLSEVPVEATIEVWVEEDGARTDFSVGSDYTYSRARNSIRFAAFVPNPLSEVFIRYESLAAFRDPDEGEDAE